jgi:hypothetical protein
METTMLQPYSILKTAGKLAGLIFLSLVLASCGTTKTTVMKSPAEKLAVSSVELVEQTSSVEVPSKVRDNFALVLNDRLFDKDGFAKGSELKLTYTFTQFDSGNMATRRILGGWGSWGKGSVIVLVRFHDTSGREIATMQAEDVIDTNVMGGALDSVLAKVAEAIADYTKKNFRS